MEGEDVDRAGLPPNRVRDLDSDQPSRALQCPGQIGCEGRVALIQERLELAASPSDHEIQLGFQGRKESHGGPERHAIRPPAFDERDHLLRAHGGTGQVDLAPTAPTAKRSDDPPDSDQVHARIVAGPAYLRIARDCAGYWRIAPGELD